MSAVQGLTSAAIQLGAGCSPFDSCPSGVILLHMRVAAVKAKANEAARPGPTDVGDSPLCFPGFCANLQTQKATNCPAGVLEGWGVSQRGSQCRWLLADPAAATLSAELHANMLIQVSEIMLMINCRLPAERVATKCLDCPTQMGMSVGSSACSLPLPPTPHLPYIVLSVLASTHTSIMRQEKPLLPAWPLICAPCAKSYMQR